MKVGLWSVVPSYFWAVQQLSCKLQQRYFVFRYFRYFLDHEQTLSVDTVFWSRSVCISCCHLLERVLNRACKTKLGCSVSVADKHRCLLDLVPRNDADWHVNFAGLYQGLKYFKVQLTYRGIEFDNKQSMIFGVPAFNQTATVLSPYAWVGSEIHRTLSYRRSNTQLPTNCRPDFLGSYVASNSGNSQCITKKKEKSPIQPANANGDVSDVQTGVTSLDTTAPVIPPQTVSWYRTASGWKAPTNAGMQSPGYACVTHQRCATATSACATGRNAER